MKKGLLISFILLNFSLLIFAQAESILLKGRVTDHETKEGIAFVSIGIEGTFIGAASNPEGYFELRIPYEHQSKTLFFSAIAYKNNSYPISDLAGRQDLVIELIPQSYNIEVIDIAAESKVLQRILRTASERIPQNFLAVPLNLKLYYEYRKSTGDLRNTEKYVVDLYDAKGYSHPSLINAHQARSYRITEAQRSDLPYSFRQNSNNLDELLEMDIVRLSNTVLSSGLLNDFTLKMEAKTRFNGDSVWIISYEAKKRDLAHTGSFYPKTFKGKLYIGQSDYAVLRNEIHLTDFKASQQGRSLAANTNPVTSIQMNITTEYRKVQGKHVLAFIDSEKQYTSADKQVVYESGKIIVLETVINGPKVIYTRDYFAETKQNDLFWQNFKVPEK